MNFVIRAVKYALVAAVGAALGGCAVFDCDDATPATGMPENLRQTTFELFFDVDRSTLSADAAEILRQVAESAKQGDVAGVDLSVHTAAAGWDAHSQALSEDRAAVVRAELIKDGVPAVWIGTVDIAPTLLRPTGDGVRAPQNRRTEIILR